MKLKRDLCAFFKFNMQPSPGERRRTSAESLFDLHLSLDSHAIDSERNRLFVHLLP